MKNAFLLLAAAVLITSCSSNNRETVSGQEFLVVRKGDGVAIDSGKYLALNFLFKDGKDSTWNDSRKNGFPLMLQKQGSLRTPDKVMEVVNMLTKGDSVTFQVSATEVFKNSFHQPVPDGVDSTSKFSFVIGLVDVMNAEQFQKFREELVAKQNAKVLKEKEAQLAKDTVVIDKYLAEKNIKVNKTASGLRYVITAAGKGPNAVDGQTVKVDYVGYLLEGKYFDTSLEPIAKEKGLYQAGKGYAPLEFKLGPGGMIQGWIEMLRLMNKGTKVTVYIPSTLGFGNTKRSEIIVENSILVFEMNLIDITK